MYTAKSFIVLLFEETCLYSNDSVVLSSTVNLKIWYFNWKSLIVSYSLMVELNCFIIFLSGFLLIVLKTFEDNISSTDPEKISF